jgi:hypothetical protein
VKDHERHVLAVGPPVDIDACAIVAEYGLEVPPPQNLMIAAEVNDVAEESQKVRVLPAAIPHHRHAASGVFGALHPDLVAVVDHGGPGIRHQEECGQAEGASVAGAGGKEALRVVTPEEIEEAIDGAVRIPCPLPGKNLIEP